MELYELSSTNYVNRFYVRSCAEVYQRAYGGVISEIVEEQYNADQETTEQSSSAE